MRMMRFASLLIIALSSSAMLAVEAADTAFSDPKDALNYRQSSFQLIRHNMADIQSMITDKTPFDQVRVKKRADALIVLSTLPWDAFSTAGAEQHPGKTDPSFWKNTEDVKLRSDQLHTDAIQLRAAADSGDRDSLKRAFSTFAKNCKACHDTYKID